MTEQIRPPAIALLAVALGGALLSSSILAVAVLLLAATGGWVITTGRLPETRWTPPKELRLIHFAFWFFVLVSVVSWGVNGFSYEGFKALGTHARLLLFWPVAIALVWSGLRARHLFILIPLLPLAAIFLFAIAAIQSPENLGMFVQRRFGGGINPILFGNLALTGSALALASSLYFWDERRKGLAALSLGMAALGVTVALFSGTRSNFVALPLLILLPLLMLQGKQRITAIALAALAVAAAFMLSDRIADTFAGIDSGNLDSNILLRFEAWSVALQSANQAPWLGLGPGSFQRSITTAVEQGQAPGALLQCCTGHAHNDALHAAATRGGAGLLSLVLLLVIPLAAFARLITNQHRPAALLALAGVMTTTAYAAFGLTEATFERSLFATTYLILIAAIGAALFNELLASYTRKRSVSVSATIITKNEEDHIAECLQSARLVADEIIVLDSGSSDRTVEIARQYADVVEVTDWPGFGVQKQRALAKATGDWVLSIDADERITPELAREINHHLANPDADAYKLPWAVTIYGKRLDFGRSGRAPLRLFRREGVSFSDALVHERILIPQGRKIRSLRGRLTHYTHRDYGHSLTKSAQYAWLGAREKHRKGKKTRSMIYPTLRGLLTFVQVYFVRFGFLDGAVGYLTAVTYAQVTFNKYAGLWTLGRDSGRNNPFHD